MKNIVAMQVVFIHEDGRREKTFPCWKMPRKVAEEMSINTMKHTKETLIEYEILELTESEYEKEFYEICDGKGD